MNKGLRLAFVLSLVLPAIGTPRAEQQVQTPVSTDPASLPIPAQPPSPPAPSVLRD